MKKLENEKASHFFLSSQSTLGQNEKSWRFYFFFSFLCSHSTPALVRGYLRRLLSDPEEAASMFPTVEFFFFSFPLTADQPLVRAWEMKKVFFSFLLSSLPAAPSRMKKLAQKTRFFTFFFHCSALTAVPRGMKKKGYEYHCTGNFAGSVVR